MIQLENNIVYITRDIERALAFDLNNPNYYIISNNSSFAKFYENKNVFLIDEGKQFDTWELLNSSKTKKIISKIDNPKILIFKNTEKIERICKENNWELLNPSAKLANKIEEKISQVNFLEEYKNLLPKFKIKLAKNINWKKEKFILQFNRSHTGAGTFLIKSKKELKKIKEKFPNREAKIIKYIDGPVFTSNNVINNKNFFISNISYQITGIKKFTNNKFSTIGNDWQFANKFLNKKQKEEYFEITKKVSEKMIKNNWQGLFGIDIIMDKKTKKMYLLEINARQPASTTFESVLQNKNNDKNKITIFEAHLLSLLKQNIKKEIIQIKNGAQIIKRILNKNYKIDYKKLYKLKNKYNLNIINYDNNKVNSEIARFQTDKNFIKKLGKLNKIAKKIQKL